MELGLEGKEEFVECCFLGCVQRISPSSLLTSGSWFPHLFKEMLVFKGRLQIPVAKRLVWVQTCSPDYRC